MDQGSILVSSTPDRYNQDRHLTRQDHNPASISWRWRQVLELHLAGLSAREISDQTGYALSTIYGILASDEVTQLKQQIMSYYDSRFEALFPEVIQTVSDALASDDLNKRLEAAKVWLKAHGKFSDAQRPSLQVNLTAEDVAIQILSQARNSQKDSQKESLGGGNGSNP